LTGAGGAGGDDRKNGHHPLRRFGRVMSGATPLTPDQGCVGIVIATALLIVSLTFWGIIYWNHETNFHADGVDESVPTVQDQLHRRISAPLSPRPSPLPLSHPQAGTRERGPGG
jgi:hypothetical protein